KLLASDEPVVSIIIPVYNNIMYTLTCILSVLESPTIYKFEIIVADDVSTDRTAEIIDKIGGCVRHLRHDKNLGFLFNCNAAAKVARGQYLVFLNNDTIILPEWLDNLISPLISDPSIGLTGSKLLNGDGTLQEAGGIFWRDGSAWNFGRGQEPWRPEFNYAKDVDYISGASIALSQLLWHELNGFDQIYAPAYCEDADLAFRVRAAGYRTRYQPHSMLVHHEGRSHGRDLTSGIKAYQVKNESKFRERWGATLKREHEDNAQNVFLARDRSSRKPHILVIDHYVPQWDRDAGSRTLYLYLRLFIESGFAVTFWADNLFEDREYTPILQRMGIEVIYSSAYIDKFPSWMFENGPHFDYAFLSRPHIAVKYIDKISEHKNIKKIYYGHDLHFRRLRQENQIRPDEMLLKEAEVFEEIEVRICCNSDVVLYPGFEEVNIIGARVPQTVKVLPFPITIFSEKELSSAKIHIESSEPQDPYKLVFVGGFSHKPNVDGIIWFAREVMPLLWRANERFSLWVAGSNAPDIVSNIAHDKIKILGRISDSALLELYRTAGIAVVPLRYGAGVKGKVIEAMAHGVPVAMTEVGAQGIPSAEHLSFVGNTPEELAVEIVKATQDRSEAVRRAVQAI
ncbi:MAG: glycosyltransferase, partial [Candidatus Obscuribacterales bacterium]|nr:glycosyltransferase [Candidatus Obscuribacterales bacterium]